MPTVLGGQYQIHISLTSHPSLAKATFAPASLPSSTAKEPEAKVASSLRYIDLFDSTTVPDVLKASLVSTSDQSRSEAASPPVRPKSGPASQAFDPRLGSLRIDFLDQVEDMSTLTSLEGAQAGSSRLADSPRLPNSAPQTPSATSSIWKARFIQSSSFPVEGEGGQTTEVLFGIVHLFREGQGKIGGEGAPQPDVALDDDSGTLLAVLGLPIQMTAAEFLGWVEPARDSIEKIRMIREANASRCTVLMQFRDASDAEEFYKQYCDQTVPYFASSGNPAATSAASSQSPTAQIVYVTQVTVSTSTQLPYAYPQLANSDPWPLPAVSTGTREGEAGSSSAPTSTTTPATRLALSLAQELPTCPVCLERMDSSVTGLMTVSCQHTFHCECLSRWGDARCPVCRYSQNRATSRSASVFGGSRHRPGGGGAAGREETNGEEDATNCTVCGTTDDLWVCLICATVGCGRYKKGCAKQHFAESGHIYSLELETSRVWDYVNDGYIHRLIQNRADGKLVELPASSQSTPVRRRNQRRGVSAEAGGSGHASRPERRGRGGQNEEEDAWSEEDEEQDDPKKSGGKLGSTDEKLEAISLEYQYLLLSQLESQRAYYEEQVRRLQTELDEVRDAMAHSQTSAPLLAAQEARFEEERQRWLLERAKLDENHSRLAARCEKALEAGSKLSSELRSERSLGRGLMERLEAQQVEMDRRRAEGEELKRVVQDQGEQLRDLMFALSATERIREAGGEAEGGDLIVRGGKQGKQPAGATATAAAAAARADESGGGGQSAKQKKNKAKKKKGKAKASAVPGSLEAEAEQAEEEEAEGGVPATEALADSTEQTHLG